MPLIALLGRLDMVEKESELYRFSIATAKTEKQRKKKTQQNTQELWYNYKRCNTQISGISERKEEEHNLK